MANHNHSQIFDKADQVEDDNSVSCLEQCRAVSQPWIKLSRGGSATYVPL